jgi:CHAT domain-containing protein
LPFAALRRASGGGAAEQYLVEWKPLHRVVSMTVYAELKGTRSKSEAPRPELLVAFGDPHYPGTAPGAATRTRGEDEAPAAAAPDATLTEAVERGLKLVALPATRKEVEVLAALYDPDAHTYLGAEASEAHAKALGREATLIHFACHALVNERFPLDSSLALSIPEHPLAGEDNGLLQAWEVFESLHLKADLVTLSACDSGLGTEMSGEGLVGLTRAFQYAGARSVLPSWGRVGDTATAALMERFYARLKGGAAKDEALRSAQVDFIRGESGSASGERSAPVNWAAWEIVGDWK